MSYVSISYIFIYTDRVHTYDMYVDLHFLEEIETLSIYIYIIYNLIPTVPQFSPQQVNTNEYLP